MVAMAAMAQGADLLSVNSVLGDLGNSLVLGNLPSTTLVAEDDLKIVTTLCNFVEFFCTVLQFNLSSEFQIPKNVKWLRPTHLKITGEVVGTYRGRGA